MDNENFDHDDDLRARHGGMKLKHLGFGAATIVGGGLTVLAIALFNKEAPDNKVENAPAEPTQSQNKHSENNQNALQEFSDDFDLSVLENV